MGGKNNNTFIPIFNINWKIEHYAQWIAIKQFYSTLTQKKKNG